jgi:hypothetical protein
MMSWMRTGVDEAFALRARQLGSLVLTIAGTLMHGQMRFPSPQHRGRYCEE